MTFGTANSALSGNVHNHTRRASTMVSQEKTAVLFVTDEIFLPQVNGSSQVYAAVARQYRASGRATYCLSFYRDHAMAFSGETQKAYSELFQDFLLVPGWNRGGGLLGAAGMGWRELSRWSTGNVFATHPFLFMAQEQIANRLLAFIRRNNIGTVYFHKLHTMLLLEPLLPRFGDLRLVIDIHDDFVTRDAEYAAAYSTVFGALSWHNILQQHATMYVRHRFSHTNLRWSRRRELSLLQRCDDIFIASEREYASYAALPELAGRVRHQPWPYSIDASLVRSTAAKPFDAGFIGAANVMNLDAVLHLRDNILPRIHAQRPDFRMLLAGTLTRKTAALLHGTPGIEAWDRLDHVRDFYAAVATAAVPLRHGTGVSVKAIEALSYGCPLVTTSIGVRGLPQAMLGPQNVAITDDPAVFAKALLDRSSRLFRAGIESR